jgi:hypothetical protein
MKRLVSMALLALFLLVSAVVISLFLVSQTDQALESISAKENLEISSVNSHYSMDGKSQE